MKTKQIEQLIAENLFTEIEIAIPQIRTLSKDQKQFIKQQIKLSHLQGYMKGLDFALSNK